MPWRVQVALSSNLTFKHRQMDTSQTEHWLANGRAHGQICKRQPSLGATLSLSLIRLSATDGSPSPSPPVCTISPSPAVQADRMTGTYWQVCTFRRRPMSSHVFAQSPTDNWLFPHWRTCQSLHFSPYWCFVSLATALQRSLMTVSPGNWFNYPISLSL